MSRCPHAFPPSRLTGLLLSRDSRYHGARLPSPSSSRRLFVVFSPLLNPPAILSQIKRPTEGRSRPRLLIRNGRFRTSWYTAWLACLMQFPILRKRDDDDDNENGSSKSAVPEGGGVVVRARTGSRIAPFPSLSNLCRFTKRERASRFDFRVDGVSFTDCRIKLRPRPDKKRTVFDRVDRNGAPMTGLSQGRRFATPYVSAGAVITLCYAYLACGAYN